MEKEILRETIETALDNISNIIEIAHDENRSITTEMDDDSDYIFITRNAKSDLEQALSQSAPFIDQENKNLEEALSLMAKDYCRDSEVKR